MLCGNILIDLALETQVLAGNDKNYVGGVTLIDYEYSAFTYRAFDLANFFCEFAGFDRSIEETYPGQDIRRAVIRAYFDACAAEYEAVRSGLAGGENSRERLIWLYWQGLRRDQSVEARAAAECIVEEFEVCVNQLTLCAHLLWYLWGIVQSTVSTVDFDYIEYVRVRLAGFRYHKSCFHPGAPAPALADVKE
jgi:ethanolamine kinase